MSVWVCLPSARPVEQVKEFTAKWRNMGYQVALWRDDEPTPKERVGLADALLYGKYPGYNRAVNTLAKYVLARDKECDWIVATGDDTDPDPTKTANEIALECSMHFYERDEVSSATFGVMQPTGDPWTDHAGRIIERIAGSPWMGREWCRRAFGGNGPLWPEFYHCFGDEHLQNVAQKLGIFWQRPDLTHLHNNWARARGEREDMPEFLTIANSPEHWKESRGIFERLKAGGFAEAYDLLP